jgi:ComF family protein
MLKLIRKTADAALDLVYPRGISCALCGGDLEKPGCVLCDGCAEKMPFITGAYCPACGRSVPAGGLCSMCREFGSPADGGVAPFSYESIARDLLLDFKFNDKTGYRELFSYYMIDSVKKIIKGDEILVPVPMHAMRKFWRGYNQSELLASWIAKELGLPLEKHALARPVYTRAASRALGGPQERMESAMKSFRPGKASVSGKTVLLVDDILTSGATIRACATILKKMGAEKVYFVVAAAVPD